MLLLVLVDVVEVDLTELLDEAQVLVAFAEAPLVLYALHVLLLVGEVRRCIRAQFLKKRDNLVEPI